MNVKQIKLFKAAIIAALLFQSAAIDAPAQKRTTRKKATRPATVTAAPASAAPGAAPEHVAPASPSSMPPPAKANSREATLKQLPAPASSKTDAAPAKASADAVRYSYEFKQPDFTVRHIVIEHDAAGRGRISFERKDSEEVFTDPLEISPAALARITAAWVALKFLESDASYQADRQFPHLGTMTLGMTRGTRKRKAEFNWTHDEQAAALVKEYKRLGEQQLFIFDVTLARQYQPSDTIKIFKRLEHLLDRNEISDPAQIAPLVRDLATDERIPLIARNHAARLLKKIEK